VAAQQAAQLNDTKDPIPRARLTIDAVFDQNGARWPLTAVRANDIIVIRNLPPTLSTTIDRIRILRAIRTELDVFSGVLTIEPESPLPSLAALLARATAPAWVTKPWWVLVNQK
jgi:sulfur carrier protein ThiS